ncbi:hypothetical protein [Tellurirhabdus rosea]|uniref:hypothetical protein n=1 Tax=Tellurirhabdus rosea TaxID=2674997 RepID=UPI00225389AC|nr:hypothetical protein [Tellurirhabdus rosea]
MKSLEINFDALVTYNLTPNQYTFLFLTHARQYALMYRFVQEGPGFSALEIGDLVDRGFVLDLNPSGYYYMDSFVLTEKVANDLFETDTEKAALEFWNTYPIQLYDRDRDESFSLLTTDKTQFLKDYYVRIGYSPEKHRRVMDALNFAIDHRMIDMSIRQWLDSEQWEAILEIRQERLAA